MVGDETENCKGLLYLLNEYEKWVVVEEKNDGILGFWIGLFIVLMMELG